MQKTVEWALLLGFVLGSAYGQVATDSPSFEVASVKRAPITGPTAIRLDAGSLRCTCGLFLIVERAYGIRSYNFIGPEWLNTESYQVIAKLPEGSTADQVPAMLRRLLADRFHFSAHKESRMSPVYALVVDKGGVKLKAAPASAPLSHAEDPAPRPRGGPLTEDRSTGRIHIQGTMTLAALAGWLDPRMDRRVVDRTGLGGEFDVLLDAIIPVRGSTGTVILPQGRISAPSADGLVRDLRLPDGTMLPGDAPSVFSAVQKLGLRLDRTQAPVEFLVIDKVDKDPTEN